jgi:hypothetical protein
MYLLLVQERRDNWLMSYFDRFPLFHRSSFLMRLEKREYLKDRGLFASTMAMCALASARARDGALYSKRWCPSKLANPPSEVFCAAAKESIPRDLAAAKGTEYLRTCAILSIAGIQNGQIQDMQQYAGIYHTLSAMEGLHDEKLWPKDLSPVEVEIRRRMVRRRFHSHHLRNFAQRLTAVLVLVHIYVRCLFIDRMGRSHPLPRSAV